ncbi:MAG: hypothetical protein R3F14_40410, partial [Polyangiaceae bacterium]
MKLVARRFNPISRRLVAMFAVLAGFSAGACIPDFNVAATGGAGGTGVGGTGGTGGASLACEPGSEMVCYTGILGTDGLGLCTPGVQVCDETENYGPCLGSGSPKLESCSSDEDENCDGLPGCVGECIWTRRFEKRDINNGSSYAAGIGGIAVDPSWNTIVAGGFDGIASGMGSSPL